jgi:hypothetical protein
VDGDVLVGRGDDLVALLEGQAVDDDIDAFGRPADETEVFFAAGPAEGPGQLPDFRRAFVMSGAQAFQL